MKRIIAAIILALLLLPAAASNASAAGIEVVDRTGDGTWIGDTWEIEIYPGETKSTTLSLYNSSSSLFDVEVSITPKSLDNGNLTFELDKASFTIAGGSYNDVTLTVKANGSATPGTYTADLTIKSEESLATAIVASPTYIDFGDVYPGGSSVIKNITIENIGNVAVSVEAELVPVIYTVFSNFLQLNGDYSWSGSITGSWQHIDGLENLPPGAAENVSAQLIVPADYLSYSYTGTYGIERTTLNFITGDGAEAEVELVVNVVKPPSRPSGGGVGGITRYLKVDLWGEDFKTRVTSAGKVRADLEAVSIDENVTLYITKGVLAQTEDEERLRKIEVLPMADPPPLPENGYIIGIAYDFIPAGATFDPAIELEIRYDPSQIPDGLDEGDLLIAYYDEEVGEWLELDGIVDTVGNTITAEVSHFTAFAILGYRVVVPAPAAFTVSKLIISPAEVDIGQFVTISAIVTNTGGEVGIYEVVLEVDGIVEDTEKVVVSAGASKKVTFTPSKDTAGSYSVDVNGLSGSFTVKAAPPPPPPPTPIPPPPEVKPVINWPLVGGIIAGVVVVGLGVFFWIRRRAERGD